MPRTGAFAVPLVVLLIACSGGGSTDFCGALDGASGCGPGVAAACRSGVAQAKSDEPSCAVLVDALTACVAKLELSCTSSTSVAAVGDGSFGGGQNFTSLGTISVVVNDSKCDVERRGLEACRGCKDAVGATQPGVLGIGDKCGSTPCAAGLSCKGGICTRSCAGDGDCKARADGCRLQSQYGNVCRAGTCTRSCGDSFSCPVWIGSGSTCASGACTL